MRNKKHQSLFIGEAGVHRVLSELYLKGINASQSGIDIGEDIFIVGKTTKKGAQIKSAHLSKKHNHYHFAFRGNYFDSYARRNLKGKHKKISYSLNRLKEVAFLILWCINDNIFLIIPTNVEELNGKNYYQITWRPKNRRQQNKDSKYDKFINAWNLIEKVIK